MRDPLPRYVLRCYLLWFALVVVCAFLSTAPLMVTRIAYFGLVPLSFANTLALGMLILQFRYRHEFEALQSLGIPLRTIAWPSIVAAGSVQLAASAMAVALAGASAEALLFAVLAALGNAIAWFVMIDRAWNACGKSIAGIAGIVITCIAAQAAFVVCTLAILWTWGLAAGWMAMAAATVVAVVGLTRRKRTSAC